MFEVTTAQDVSDADLSAAMADAFSDYAIPVTLDEAAFAFMMQQRGLNREASRVAIVDGEIAAIWLVSIRDRQGYLISSGTRPPFRSQGMARAMALSCLEGLRARDVSGFQTEVLRVNETAAGLYLSLGMTVARELDCFVVSDGIGAGAGKVPVDPVPWSRLVADAPALRDWRPSWQHDDPSVAAIADHVVCLATYDEDGLAGYAVASPASGTVFQLAVRKDVRRRGIATALLGRLHSDMPDKPLRFINVDHGDAGFRAFVMAHLAEEVEGQFELAMPL